MVGIDAVVLGSWRDVASVIAAIISTHVGHLLLSLAVPRHDSLVGLLDGFLAWVEAVDSS